MSRELIEHIRRYIPNVNIDEAIISDYFKTIRLKNKEYLLEEGRICKANYFVIKGCLRMFYINEKGHEQITLFALENWWIADYFSMLGQKPSDYYLQAIEKCEILALDNAMQDKLCEDYPELIFYFRTILQKTIGAAQLRSKLLYELSKEEFYLHFSSAFPDFIQRAPQYMIASYLGISPEYLSEIKSKKLK